MNLGGFLSEAANDGITTLVQSKPLRKMNAMSLYQLKPKFQNLLRPFVAKLAAAGVTANQVTVAACVISVLIGGLIMLLPWRHGLFLLIPVWMALRMAFNAIDGMLAREFGQKSRLGGYLNELTDVISDTALILPFATLPVFGFGSIGVVIFLAVLSEYAGVMGPLVGTERRYDGPLGKSDRALVFGAIGLWVGLGLPLAPWLWWLMPPVALLLVWTIVNRVRKGLSR
jgi:CDP-diacylglycerol---glycerol-3-phosphate 3-phosphatidyltransferase